MCLSLELDVAAVGPCGAVVAWLVLGAIASSYALSQAFSEGEGLFESLTRKVMKQSIVAHKRCNMFNKYLTHNLFK